MATFPCAAQYIHVAYLFNFYFLALRGISVPQPGIKPVPLAVEAWSLNHCTSREVPRNLFIYFLYIFGNLFYSGFYLLIPYPSSAPPHVPVVTSSQFFQIPQLVITYTICLSLTYFTKHNIP